jgi:hypothetical protein
MKGKMTIKRAEGILYGNPMAGDRNLTIEAAQYVLAAKSAPAPLHTKADDILNDIWIEEAQTVKEHNERILHLEAD